MKRNEKELRRENNLLEKQLSKENQAILTDIVVYLKSFDISEYRVEIVRQDITNMILEGERRNLPAEDVIGPDYKAFCDSIVSELPHLTRKEKFWNVTDSLLLELLVLLPLWALTALSSAWKVEHSLPKFPVYAGTLFSFFFIVVLAQGIVWYITKTSFDKEEPFHGNRWKQWLALTAILLICFLPSFFLRYVLFYVHFGYVILLYFLLFAAYRLLEFFKK